MMNARQGGFTLIEIAIVLLIVTILLGYTVALFPRQQELRQYREVDRKMDEVIVALIGFAQINGRLPCPAIPNSAGVEDGGGAAECNNFGGFVPVNTLGITGRLNADSLLIGIQQWLAQQRDDGLCRKLPAGYSRSLHGRHRLHSD